MPTELEEHDQGHATSSDSWPQMVAENPDFPSALVKDCVKGPASALCPTNGRSYKIENVIVPRIANISDDPSAPLRKPADYAFGLIQDIRECESFDGGKIWHGRLLKRRIPTPDQPMEWEITPTEVAAKEWPEIMRCRETDPFREIGARQYLQHCFESRNPADQEVVEEITEQIVQRKKEMMIENGIVTAIDAMQNDKNLFVIMPFFKGRELFSRVDPNMNFFTEPEARYWLKQMLIGMKTLQNAKICHGSISDVNCITSANGRALITGLSKCFRIPYVENNGIRQRCLTSADGGIWGQAPEFYRNEGIDGNAVDIFGLGGVLLSMTTGCKEVETAQLLTDSLSKDLTHLLHGMICSDPRQRLSLQQVATHPWMNGPLSEPKI